MEDLLPPRQRFWSPTKIASGAIVVTYLIVGLLFQDLFGLWQLVAFSVVPIFCIWFPEMMAQSYVKHTATGVAPPAGCIAALGWFVLLLPIVQVATVLVELLR